MCFVDVELAGQSTKNVKESKATNVLQLFVIVIFHLNRIISRTLTHTIISNFGLGMHSNRFGPSAPSHNLNEM